MNSEGIRVLIADDHAVLRAGLRLLLDAQPDMVVVGEAETAETAIMLDADLRPDVVLMDLALPLRPGEPNRVPSGLEAIQRIKAERPEAQVLALTMHDDEGYLRAVLEAGGAGYVLKQAADTELLSAIRAVWRGGTYLHPEHVQVLLEGAPFTPVTQESAGDSYELLSPREQQVLRLVALGHTNQQGPVDGQTRPDRPRRSGALCAPTGAAGGTRGVRTSELSPGPGSPLLSGNPLQNPRKVAGFA
jgi:two-component system response regulator NreC